MSRIFRLPNNDKLSSESVNYTLSKSSYYDSNGTSRTFPFSNCDLKDAMCKLLEPYKEKSCVWYMNGTSQTVTLEKHISEYLFGIWLAFSYYNPSNSTAGNNNWRYYFIPKWHSPTGSITVFGGGTEGMSSFKFLYFGETTVNGKKVTTIYGVSNNGGSSVSGQVGTYLNNKMVLRGVYTL